MQHVSGGHQVGAVLRGGQPVLELLGKGLWIVEWLQIPLFGGVGSQAKREIRLGHSGLSSCLDEEVLDAGSLHLRTQQLGSHQHALVDIGLGQLNMGLDCLQDVVEKGYILPRLGEANVGLGGGQGGAVLDPSGFDFRRLSRESRLIDPARQLTAGVERHRE